jgi:DNA polymerase-3 subunit gamma/tau
MRARLDRLERRFAIESGPAPRHEPTAGTGASAAAAVEVEAAQEVVETAVTPEPVDAAEPAEAAHPSQVPHPPQGSEVSEATDSAAVVVPEGVVAPAAVEHLAPPAQAPTQAPTQPQAAPADGGLDLHAVRRMWPEILEQVKVKRRVTWMLLFDKVQVLGLDGSALTLGFPDAGSVKGFTAGGHDEVLRQAVIDMVGADWRIDCVHQPGSGGGPGSAPASPASPSAPPAGPAGPAGPASNAPGPRAARGVPPGSSAPPAPTGSADQSGGVGPGSPLEDLPADDDEDAADSGLAGAELVARELGGRVIGEFGAT